MNALGLPDDCFEFLNQRRQLDFDHKQCEAGPILLRSVEELKGERLPVETYSSSFYAEDPQRNQNSRSAQSGFYYVLAIPLTTGQFVSEAVLSWLPKEETFAAYDESHHDILLFPGATWPRIIATPLRYLNVLWEVDYEDRNNGFVNELKPWLDHPFRLGLTLPEVERNRKI